MRVAIAQFAPVLGRVQPNVEVIVTAATEAAAAGARLLVGPEMCLTGWSLRDAVARERLARAVEEIALPAVGQTAMSLGIAIVVGGPVLANGGTASRPSLSNAAVILEGGGRRIDYRKIHLFDEERSWWLPGTDTPFGLVDGVRVGVTICYDAEFPEVPRMARLAGAEILAIPATNMSPYERDQDLIFATRGLENECPVLLANRVGREGKWSYFGRSVVIDQRGRVVAQAGANEELLLADIEPRGPADEALSYLAQRRPEVYRALAESGPKTV